MRARHGGASGIPTFLSGGEGVDVEFLTSPGYREKLSKLITTNHDGDDYSKGRIQKYIHPECVLNHCIVFVGSVWRSQFLSASVFVCLPLGYRDSPDLS